MNQRIKSLIDQATVWQGMENGYIFDKEKFAELIVRECIELCAKEHAHSIHTLAGPWNSAINRCKENIATQFGVDK